MTLVCYIVSFFNFQKTRLIYFLTCMYINDDFYILYLFYMCVCAEMYFSTLIYVFVHTIVLFKIKLI